MAAGLICLAGCATVQTTKPGAIGVERRQQMLVGEGDIEQGADLAYTQELDKARNDGKLNSPPAFAWGLLLGFLTAYSTDLVLTFAAA